MKDLWDIFFKNLFRTLLGDDSVVRSFLYFMVSWWVGEEAVFNIIFESRL